MMKITGLSHLSKWENLHNWWLTKYIFAPLYRSGLLKTKICSSDWRNIHTFKVGVGEMEKI